ncbi:hypothetical protein Sjap_016682 [Stephania japonica]|uniref:Chalcone synthase n=1 Tax=Stephania japonica TaxID=461633 RepID=A0AAP0IMB5_9MAGN
MQLRVEFAFSEKPEKESKNFDELLKSDSDGYDFVEDKIVFREDDFVIEVVSLFKVPQVFEVVGDTGANKSFVKDFFNYHNLIVSLSDYEIKPIFENKFVSDHKPREGTKIRGRIFLNRERMMKMKNIYAMCGRMIQALNLMTNFLNWEIMMQIRICQIREAQRAHSPASVLAIGTATPTNCIYQADYPDYYFRVTKSQHLTDLKEKFTRMCEKSMIRKRYMHLTEDILKENPSICTYDAPSLNARQDIIVIEVPKLGEEAATKAIKEWGQPKSKITHLVFCTTSGVDMPGADYQLTKLLGLRSSVNRVMLYHQGCFAGGTVLRIAKDIAENNKGARVLVVCSEITVVTFRGTSDAHLDNLVGQALFGDGASAIIVGSDPDLETERPLFEIISAGQTILPDSHGAVEGHLREVGLTFHLSTNVAKLISKNIERCLVEAFRPIGISDWNSLFWIAHPGGPAILDQVEEKLGLNPEKLKATRHVLSEYGNMSSACVLFIMDEVRKRSIEDGASTTGQGLEWGVLFGFGPGLTVETVVLHSVATTVSTH